MPIPDATLTIVDNSLGILPEDASADTAAIGACSLGTPNTIYPFRGVDAQTVKDTLGVGPLVEKTVFHLAKSEGKTVYAVPVNASVAGASGAITKSNAGGPTITLSGAPKDDAQAQIVIVTTGVLGAGVFKFTLDGGDTWSPDTTIPSGGTYVLAETGVTATFPAGTYTAGDTYTWTATAPSFVVNDFSAAMDALLADGTKKWGIVHLVGQATDAAGTVTLATTMGSKLATAAAAYRYACGVIECPAVDKALLIAAFANFVDARVMVVGGWHELQSDVTSRVYKRPAAWSYVARLAKVPISIHPSRDASDVNLEALAGVIRLVPTGAAASTGYHDENVTPAFDSARFVSLRTITGRQGFYVTNGKTMAGTTSDFGEVQYRRIMDRGCDVTRNAILAYLNKKLLVDKTTGQLLEDEAQGIEADVGGQLRTALVQDGHASDVTVVVNRTDNLLSTKKLRVKVRIVPPGYSGFIEVEIGFRNPALQPV